MPYYIETFVIQVITTVVMCLGQVHGGLAMGLGFAMMQLCYQSECGERFGAYSSNNRQEYTILCCGHHPILYGCHGTTAGD